MIRIVLLDDHAIVREGIKRLLESEPDIAVCAECATVAQALTSLQRSGPDVLIVDISLADGNSFSLVENLAKAGVGVKVLMLSMHESPAFVGKSLSLGAAGYVTKAAAAKELVPALRRVMDGDTYVSSDIRRPAPSGVPKLTQRESDTLKLLLQGLSAKTIAARLGINDKTMYGHRANIMLKLQARDLTDLQEKAVRLGLLD